MHRPRRLIVFTDLDGSLLDFHTYSMEAAGPALHRLDELGCPLVIVSSKTRAEVDALTGLPAKPLVFITENGSGVYVHQDMGIDQTPPLEIAGEYSVLRLGSAYADILRCCREGNPLESFVNAGLAAEARMFRAIRSNAHKGYIFLSGLALMAACDGDGPTPGLRNGISETARRFFAHFEPRGSHGAEIRQSLSLGGIRQEAEAGLPAVFEHGWPGYRRALEAGWELERAGHYLMAVLMQHVEDTTAIRRCGLEGLARLQEDGAHLQALLERGEDAPPVLSALNEEYRRTGLTMGGVADCIALVFALEKASR